jgi:hypothetical protein
MNVGEQWVTTGQFQPPSVGISGHAIRWHGCCVRAQLGGLRRASK